MNATARNIESLLMRRVAAVGQADLAAALDCDKTRISRFFSNEASIRLDELTALFDALGLAVVEVGGDSVTLPRRKLDALRTLARESLGDEFWT